MSKTNQLPTTFAGGGRVLSLILAGTLAMGMTPAVSIAVQTAEPAQAWAEEGVLELIASEEASYASTYWLNNSKTEGDWQYYVDGDVAYLGKYNGTDRDVTLPTELGGLPITEVRGGTFWGNENIDSVTVPEGYTYLYFGIFKDSSVKTVSLPSTLKGWTVSDGEGRDQRFYEGDFRFFEDCGQLTTIIVDANNPYVCVADGILYNKDKSELIAYPAMKSGTDFVLPSGVARIANGAFAHTTQLERLVIPAGVTSISDGSTLAGSSIKTIELGEGVTSYLNPNSFGAGLEEIIIAENDSDFKSEAGVLYNKDMTELIAYPAAKEATEFAIPDGVQTIRWNAFSRTTKLEKLYVPNSVVEIGSSAFSGPSIKSIEFNSNEQIADVINGNTFGTGLEQITVTGEVSSISVENNVIYNRDKTELILYAPAKTDTEFTIPDTVVSVKEGAFARTANLNTLNVPDSVVSVGNLSFAGPSINTINLGVAVKDIDGNAFGVGLEQINIIGDNSNFTTSEGVLYDKNMTKIVACPTRIAGATYTAPSSVTSIGTCAFRHRDPFEAYSDHTESCVGSVNEVVFPSKILAMDDKAFCGFNWCRNWQAHVYFLSGIAEGALMGLAGSESSDAYYIGDESVRTAVKNMYYDKETHSRYFPIDFSLVEIDLSRQGTEFEYTGYPIETWFEFKDKETGESIWGPTKDVDYDVSYENNIEPGEATVTVTGKGKYHGSTSATFLITGDGSGDTPVNPVDPVYPIEPVEPVDPVDPVDPEDPEDPENPEEPTEPIDPVEPVEPVDPVDPVEPVDPVDPVDPEPEPEPEPTPEPEPEPTPDPNPEGTWVKDETGWWLKGEDGTYPTNEWVQVGDSWYHFDNSGYMQTGWQKLGGSWYYLNDSGAMQTGWEKVDNKWYYLNDSGRMQTGWQQIGDTWYCLDESGAMQTGWVKEGATWYYLNDSGAMTTGWNKVGNTWYHMDEQGHMQTGWQEIDGNWHYLDESGAMQTGWVKQGSTWYYLNNSGAMTTGWQKVNGSWYHLDDKGHMQTGWQEIDGVWYYLNASGAMQTNCWVGNYWVDASGAMATNTTVDNGRYQVDESGRWVK